MPPLPEARKLPCYPEEDRLLLELSLDPKTHKKTRLWAAMVRLAAEGWTAP